MRAPISTPYYEISNIKTIVGVGVSVNIAIPNFVMDAVNRGYQFVLPRDAVSGYPREYAESMIDNTLSLLATVTTSEAVVNAWGEFTLRPDANWMSPGR